MSPNWYALALFLTPGIGPVHFHALREAFPELSELFSLSEPALAALSLPAQSRVAIRSPDWERVEQQLQWAQASDQQLIAYEDPAYPPRLREIYAPPPFLYSKGNVEVLSKIQLAMVGTRYPSHRAKEDAFYFAKALSEAGCVVTSGLALGIDAASHRGAISAVKPSVAVMGVGLEQIYPRSNRALAQSLLDTGGAWVSEFPLGSPLRPENFPRRNRIISGLSVGVFVVEAALRSGSLITARYAIEQGREVYAMPHSLHHPLGKGCHALLKQGAKLVEDLSDILPEICLNLGLNSLEEAPLEKRGKGHLPDWIEFTPATFDDIVARSGLSPKAVSLALARWELAGLIRNEDGRYGLIE